MEQYIHFKDGKEVAISDETAENLRNLKEEKREIRHGDYGHSYKGNSRLYLEQYIGKPERGVVHVQPDGAFVKADSYFSGKLNEEGSIILGNIFDDLKDLGEDLEEFKVEAEGANGEGFCGAISIKSIRLNCKKFLFSQDEVVEIIKGLRQLIATAKRKQGDC